ncbi:Transcriptional regulator of acetoin/glycerol metabolism [Modicisalibacter ilicicola DSM 19980]|uniref:Transcriptional regulator of acetoin/glycerol metabolism n=1 Tax=Modicisalibacter ilicicola DSM 19980 TaxID=1121942 RepID=A0A1M5BF28_9GAMM|nr:sigma-54-dependent Fis family transcriptional regulator [Halomonas ilicicola]SHF41046.1 Transcriptional regulator of acetoin/glycerol metabolism [Halomonas ilicicola DSM 19980]
MSESAVDRRQPSPQRINRASPHQHTEDRQWHPRRCSAADTAQRLATMQPLLSLLGQGVIAEFDEMLRHWQCCLVVTDRDGVILERWGETPLLPPACQAWLSPGAHWGERYCGRNAIGTCLAKGRSVDVIGDEHACGALHHLASFAVPLKLPNDNVDACLALLSDPYRNPTRHHSGLLQVLSMQIENRRLINHYRHDHYRLTFNSNRDNLDSPRSGLLILDGQGRLVASNSRARWLLGLEAEHARGQHLESLCDENWQAIVAHLDGDMTLRFAGRYHCHCRLAAPISAAPAGAPASPLQRLDLGDPRMHQAITLASRLKDSGIAMLIRGETGTGKEVFVKALHAASRRASQPLVAINCAAIPSELVEAELFGYVRGAFTGADPRGNIGRLREADGGRLFLDEIGDMPLAVQARLLRVLQERRVTPLGGGVSYPVDIEVIAATHRPLIEDVATGRFRADLFYRLCGVEILLPPLREREDRQMLVQAVLDGLIRDAAEPLRDDPRPGFSTPSPALLDWLIQQPWPGNIRQLENVLRVAMAMADGPVLELHHLPANLLASAAPPATSSLGEATPPHPASGSLSLAERLAEHGGNLSALARQMGISRTTLYKRLREQAAALQA